jgi:ArsR family transcriptional regulator
MVDRSAPNGGCCPPAEEARRTVSGSPEDEVELALIAKALGHPMRVRILRLLAERHACQCGQLVDELPISQATVSQHLKMLKEAGLVQGETDGPRVCYCASSEQLGRFEALLGLVRQPDSITQMEALSV